MRDIFESPFARTLTVVHDGERTAARVFLQPLSLRSPEGPELTPAGTADGRRYLAIVEPMCIRRGDGIETARSRFRVERSEDLGGHIECVLRVEAGDGDA